VNAPPNPDETAPAERQGFWKRFSKTLETGRQSYVADLKEVFGRPALDAAFWDDLEATLIAADAGVPTTERVVGDLRRQAAGARYVTSVCTGSLVLGAAGLLKGYKSACHWAWRDMLKDFGAIPVAERVVRDRNRISGGGVTAGIDFGLTVAAELAGEEVAKSIQLVLEYDPQPPFDSGSPEKAGAERVKRIRERLAPLLESRSKANAQAAARMQ